MMTTARSAFLGNGWFAAISGVLLAASSLHPQTAARLKVVASTSDLAALALEVGGDRVHVEALAPGAADPHSVPEKSSYLLKLQHADLLIAVGLELDTWLTGRHHIPSALSQSGNSRIQPGASGYFDASQYAEILEIPTSSYVRDIHPLGNPHYWLDPDNGRRIAQALAGKLRDLRPSDGTYFLNRFQVFRERLADEEKAWSTKLRPYRGTKVITYRRSWSNFLKHFQLVSIGEIEPSAGIPPSERHTKELIRLMRDEKVRIILVEPYFRLDTANAIAGATGAKVVIMAPSVGSMNGISDYFKLFDYDLTVLTKALQSLR
jgi:ABC-type Zn uptake system ZnuABC Zn-binding protein ZnuA